ncbi:MAG TPA: glycosyltransferase family 39 protein [Thermoanaerobaculia bacterium]|nr:glycosyltransferase family 39 protein [Thermoanaerobaculia bacterium]
MNPVITRHRIATSIALAIAIALVLSFRLGHPMLHTDEITYMSGNLEAMNQGALFPVKGDGRLFANKPPLALWMIRLSFEVLGPSPFAARLPSVLAASATAVVIYLFGSILFGEWVGVLAALIFPLTPGLATLHGIRSATPDSFEILLITSAIACLEIWRRRRRPWSLAALVALVGATAWVKSPFALIVFLAYLLATEWTARRAGLGTPRPVLTVALVVGVWTVAYCLWVGVLLNDTSPRAVRRLFMQQYVRRIEGRLGRHHIKGRDYYLDSVARDFGPLLLLPVGAVAAGWLASRRGRHPARPLSHHEVTCLAVWALAAPALATVSANKLEWYAYLSYPGIALLLAVSARRLTQAAADRTSVQATLLAATVLMLVWRLPTDRLWPAEPQYKNLTGRFWEIARRDRIAVVPGQDFHFFCRQDDGCREARLFVRALFYEQFRRRSSGQAGQAQCHALLINHRRDASVRREALVLYKPTRGNAGLFLVDRCDGRLRGQLTGASS